METAELYFGLLRLCRFAAAGLIAERALVWPVLTEEGAVAGKVEDAGGTGKENTFNPLLVALSLGGTEEDNEGEGVFEGGLGREKEGAEDGALDIDATTECDGFFLLLLFVDEANGFERGT